MDKGVSFQRNYGAVLVDRRNECLVLSAGLITKDNLINSSFALTKG